MFDLRGIVLRLIAFQALVALFVVPPVLAQAPITNLGASDASFVGAWLVYTAAESLPGADLNGDGDTEDEVVHVYNTTTGETTNLKLAGSTQRASGDWQVLRVSEPAQRQDLNGDGDTEDTVVHVHNLATGKTTNLRLAGSTRGTYGDRLLLSVSEREQSADLNDDGDTEDHVVHVHNLATGESTNLRLAGWVQFVTGDWIVLTVSGFVHVYNLVTGETRDLKIPAGGGPDRLRVSGSWLIIPFYEHTTRQDLNGDGDTKDAVIHVHKRFPS